MEITQTAVLKLSGIEDVEVFNEFMEEEGGIFAEELDEDIDDLAEIEVMDEYETFEDMIETLKGIVSEYPKLVLTLEGQEDTTYDGIEYKIEYKNNVMTINTSDRFYKRYPEEYDEFVDYCEEFGIEDVLEEDAWNTMNDEADEGWYFIEGKEAKINIELTESQIINF